MCPIPSRCVPTWLWLSHVSSMYVTWFSPKAPPGASECAVSTVFENRVPKSGTPSFRMKDIGMALPSWISAAAALVTAGVTRLVAPVWSVGPNGEGATKFLHAASPCANAGAASARTSARVAAIRTSLMAPSFRVTPLGPSTLPGADPRRRP